MPELSNLLRQRLAATENGASAHPDPDVLNAYTEHCLPATERQAVVAHLSVCGPCREVVALSRPQIPELAAQTVVRPAPASVWRRLFTPAFGIVGAVAAMAIIAVLVLQLPQKSVQESALPRTTETQQANATPAADQPLAIETGTSPDRPAAAQSASTANLDVAVPVKKAPVVELRQEATRNRIDAASNAPAPPPSPERTLALTAAMQKKDYINTNFFATNDVDRVSGNDQRNTKLSAAPQPQPSSANGAFGVTGGKITIFSDIPTPNAESKPNGRLLTPTPPSQRFGWMLGKMATATAHTLHLHTPGTNPALRASNLGYSTLGGPGMFSNSLAKSQSTEVSAAPEKLENGSLAKSDALSAGAMGGAISPDSASTLWKVADGKLIKSAGPSQWEDAYPTSSFEFSVVNSHGNDVWAGGTNASIIHSRDGGLTWENLKLGDAATGTIVSILPEVLNVQVKTSDNQLWSSTDGGKTWTMQND
ncbi:MAG TPA: YCF48-related protein [Candidatus Angelobacter sp.]|jgi:hypothetical protein